MGPMSRAIHQYNFQIYVVTDDKHDIVETLGEMNNFNVAMAAFDAALKERALSTIQLRERSRILWTGITGRYNSETRTVELLERY